MSFSIFGVNPNLSGYTGSTGSISVSNLTVTSLDGTYPNNFLIANSSGVVSLTGGAGGGGSGITSVITSNLSTETYTTVTSGSISSSSSYLNSAQRPSYLSGAVTAPSGISQAGRWNRYSGNYVVSPSGSFESTSCKEPNVIPPCSLCSTWQMWYTGGQATTAICYATSVDGLNWTKYSGNPILGAGAVTADQTAESSIIIVNGEYWLYFCDASINIYLSKSSNGYSGWSTPIEVLTASYLGIQACTNTQVIQLASDLFYMFVECATSGYANWVPYLLSSPDGENWTLVADPSELSSLNPPDGVGNYGQGPMIPFLSPLRNGLYTMWYHASSSNASDSDLYYATSPDLMNWTIANGGSPILTHLGSGQEVNQIADIMVVEYNGTSYLYFDAGDNSPSDGYYNATIGVATINASLAQIVDGAPAPLSAGSGITISSTGSINSSVNLGAYTGSTGAITCTTGTFNGGLITNQINGLGGNASYINDVMNVVMPYNAGYAWSVVGNSTDYTALSCFNSQPPTVKTSNSTLDDGNRNMTLFGNLSATGHHNLYYVPTTDPAVSGCLWNNSGTLSISAG